MPPLNRHGTPGGRERWQEPPASSCLHLKGASTTCAQGGALGRRGAGDAQEGQLWVANNGGPLMTLAVCFS